MFLGIAYSHRAGIAWNTHSRCPLHTQNNWVHFYSPSYKAWLCKLNPLNLCYAYHCSEAISTMPHLKAKQSTEHLSSSTALFSETRIYNIVHCPRNSSLIQAALRPAVGKPECQLLMLADTLSCHHPSSLKYTLYPPPLPHLNAYGTPSPVSTYDPPA